MKSNIVTTFRFAALTSTLIACTGLAQTPAKPQAGQRPFGLDVVGKVMVGGSDKTSAVFQKEVLPDMTKLLNTTFAEGQGLKDGSSLLDPSKLTLKNQVDARVYFIGEGASYHNTLGFTTDGSGSVDSRTAALIFPDSSSSVSALAPDAKIKRTGNEPLLPGDFVDLGSISSGTQLDFFLIADGANGGKTTFSTQTSENPDGISHVISFAYALPNSPYLIIGFEDLLGGGDRDFNDVLVAIDIGAANVAALTTTPEPAMIFTLGSFAGLAAWLRRRQRSAAC